MNVEFKTRLTTAILSCPIVYIPHYHLDFIDETLIDIIHPDNGFGFNEFNIYSDIIEYDSGQKCVVNFTTKRLNDDFPDYESPSLLIKHLIIGKLPSPSIVLLKNFEEFLTDYETLSLLNTFAELYERGKIHKYTTIIIVSSLDIASLPNSLKNIITAIEILPPTVDEIKSYLIDILGEEVFLKPRDKVFAENMVRTLQGLQMYEIKQTMKTVLELTNNRLNSKAIRIALQEKGRIVKKTGIIEVIEPNVKFEDVGGLNRLISDLEIKAQIYNNLGDASKYNIPIPKGILIIGMPGCGKSMIAQATANKFGVSLLRLDVSRLMGKYVGESEANLRLALRTAEAAHPCVLWIDEIEKAFAGSNNSNGSNDMLVMRMMGHFLTWMQERKTPVYIVATANDVMRPEFMRKGRFDEVYFVNFPEPNERAQILKKKIEKRYPQESNDCLYDFSELGDYMSVVSKMKGEYGGFSGAEIECALNMVVEEKFTAFLKEKTQKAEKETIVNKIKITESDFNKVIEKMKDSVMANQKGKKNKVDNQGYTKTAIERIIEMQEIFNFPNAK